MKKQVFPRTVLAAALILLPAAQAIAQQSIAAAAPGAPPLSMSGQGLSLDQPATRIYRSVDAAGSVSFSDEPSRGARAVEIRSYATSSDREAIETARRQRDYWRAQADGLSRRLQDRASQEARERAEEERRIAERIVVVVPRHLRPPARAVPLVPVPGGYGAASGGYGSAPGGVGVSPGGYGTSPGSYGTSPGSYGTSPGAAAGAPAAFIGSGFSTAR